MERKQGYYDTVRVKYNDSTFLEGNLVICDVKPIVTTMTQKFNFPEVIPRK